MLPAHGKERDLFLSQRLLKSAVLIGPCGALLQNVDYLEIALFEQHLSPTEALADLPLQLLNGLGPAVHVREHYLREALLARTECLHLLKALLELSIVHRLSRWRQQDHGLRCLVLTEQLLLGTWHGRLNFFLA